MADVCKSRVCLVRRCRQTVLFVAVLGILLCLSASKVALPSRSVEAVLDRAKDSEDKVSSFTTKEAAREASFLGNLLVDKHPNCAVWFTDPSIGQKANARFVVDTSAQFIRVDKAQPRYDHQSCFLMKSRYNCAKGGDETVPEAAYWKLVLRDPTNNSSATNQYCDLASFIDDLGGPSGLVRLYGDQQSPLSIVMEGNSFMRQVFEAMVCGFRQQLVNLKVVLHSPPFTLKTMAEYRQSPIQHRDLGQIQEWNSSLDWNMGCHGGSRIDHLYGPNLTVPPSVADCSDDVAMAEFSGDIQLSYVNRPNLYSRPAIDQVYSDLLGWSVEEESIALPKRVGHVLWRNHKQLYAMNRLHHPSNTELLTHEEDIEFLKDALQEIQERHAGRFWGADNVGMTEIPDKHPCMPGMPDDEANLLLFSFLVAQHWKKKALR